VLTFAEATERLHCHLGPTDINCNALDVCTVEKCVQLGQAAITLSADEDKRRFDHTEDRDQPNGIGINQIDKCSTLRLQQTREHGGRVYDHHHMPFSS
jgi:hypothetical protein